MSLFDILKYGNTDLSNEEELQKLPIELLDLYWHYSVREHSDGWTMIKNLSDRVRYLSAWYGSINCRNDPERYTDEQIKAFECALKEYNNEPL